MYVRDFVEKTLENVLDEIIENGKKINETLIAKELMSYLRFKINDFVENEVDKEFDEILEEE